MVVLEHEAMKLPVFRWKMFQGLFATQAALLDRYVIGWYIAKTGLYYVFPTINSLYGSKRKYW